MALRPAATDGIAPQMVLHQVALRLAQGDGITPLKVLTLIGLTPPMVLHRMALRRNAAFSTSSTLRESRKTKKI